MTMQKSLQAVQDLTKKNKEYEQEVRRLKDEKHTKNNFRKWWLWFYPYKLYMSDLRIVII